MNIPVPPYKDRWKFKIAPTSNKMIDVAKRKTTKTNTVAIQKENTTNKRNPKEDTATVKKHDN